MQHADSKEARGWQWMRELGGTGLELANLVDAAGNALMAGSDTPIPLW